VIFDLSLELFGDGGEPVDFLELVLGLEIDLHLMI